MEKQFDMHNTSAFKFIETFYLIVVSQTRSSVYRTRSMWNLVTIQTPILYRIYTITFKFCHYNFLIKGNIFKVWTEKFDGINLKRDNEEILQ